MQYSTKNFIIYICCQETWRTYSIRPLLAPENRDGAVQTLKILSNHNYAPFIANATIIPLISLRRLGRPVNDFIGQIGGFYYFCVNFFLHICQRFHIEFLKMAASAVLHCFISTYCTVYCNLSNDQYSSRDSTTVLRTASKSCRVYTLEVPVNSKTSRLSIPDNLQSTRLAIPENLYTVRETVKPKQFTDRKTLNPDNLKVCKTVIPRKFTVCKTVHPRQLLVRMTT